MSIKIYYGIKVEDMEEFISEVQQYKERILNKYMTSNRLDVKYEIMHKYVEESMSEGFGLFESVNAFERAFRRNKVSGELMYEPVADLKIRAYNNSLAYPHTINQEILQDIAGFKSVKEYGYWDNVDKIETVSDEDWEIRRKDWESVIDSKDYIDIDVYTEEVTISEYGEWKSKNNKF